MSQTIADFWNLISDNRIKRVFMLTKVKENGKTVMRG